MILVQVIPGQDIDWSEYTGRTGIQVRCDTPGISIYLDGDKVGVSPMENIVEVPEGWHYVSLFPEMDGDAFVPERIRNIQRLGSKRVLVRFGEVSTVTLSYRSLDDEASEIAVEERTSAWIGYSLFLVTIVIVVWGMF